MYLIRLNFSEQLFDFILFLVGISVNRCVHNCLNVSPKYRHFSKSLLFDEDVHIQIRIVFMTYEIRNNKIN